MNTNPKQYQEFCASTYAAPEDVDRMTYLTLLYFEELGELCSLYAKAMRDGVRKTCRVCKGHGFVDVPGRRERVKCSAPGCDRGGYIEYGPEAVDADSLKKELGDTMWCSALIGLETQGQATAETFEGQRLDLYVLLKSAAEYGREYIEAGRPNLQFPFTVQEIVDGNVAKLESRRRRGTIHGKGDNR